MKGRAAGILALAWTVGVLPSLAGASGGEGSTLDFARLSQSVRQQASGMTYGNYEPLKLFANPALLAYQPNSWDIGLTGGSRFDSEASTIGLAGGWMGQPRETGSYGFFLAFSNFGMSAFKEVDILGNEVAGSAVEPAGRQIGAGGAYQWQFVSFGVLAAFADEKFGDSVNGDTSKALITAGLAVSLGNLELGAAYRNVGGPTALEAGAVFRSNGWFKGALGIDASIPMDNGAGMVIGGGVTWQTVAPFALHLGIQNNGGDGRLGAGFTANYRGYSLDYCFSPSLDGQLGTSHLASLGWRLGKVRVSLEEQRKAREAAAPKFQMGEKETTLAVSNFEAQNVSAGDAAVISDMLRNQFVKEGVFNIVEKASMDKILQEQAFQQTGCTSAECAVKLGKLLNVKYLVVGSFGKVMETYMVSMRVVDIETARAIYSDEGEGKDLTGIRESIKQMAGRLTEAVKKAK